MTWKRLESATVGADLTEGLEARLADPLWLLGKQWQVGEFKGEDAASPVLLEAELDHAPVTRYRPGAPDGGGGVVEREGGGLPLETAVEREGVRDGPAAVRLAAEAGLQLWRFLDAAGVDRTVRARVRAAFPLTLPADDGFDPVGRAELSLLARRSFDARTLYARLQARGGRGLAAFGPPEVRKAVRAWADWYASWVSEPREGTTSWDPSRMEYRFQVAAGVTAADEVQLDAVAYPGGHLDWYTFDLAPENPDMGARGVMESHSLRVIPTPVRFSGQAASRFWQVEEGGVWFGDLATAPEDLARLAVAAFGTVFGDDWFLVPCRLPVGVLARVREVRLYDTFGEVHTIRSCAELDGPDRTWRFFELTGDASADAADLVDRVCPWLFLPPALPGVVQSHPIEEVCLLRDEVANLGWGTEQRIESAAGRVIDRAAAARAAAPPAPEAAEDAWLYQLSTRVLDHQVPLVPCRSTTDGGLYLQRGRFATSAAAGGVTTRGALGRILEPDRALFIRDDVVPSTGVRVTRTWQMARTGDGGAVLWVGRRKTPSGPRRSPGLVFDEVERD